jgi:hypothetical protein
MSRRRSLAVRMCTEESSSSEDEELYAMASVVAQQEHERLNAPRHRGSVLGRQVIDRERAEGCIRLHRDYFTENIGYPARLFRQRYAIVTNVHFLLSC